MSGLSEGLGEEESVDYWMSDWAEKIQGTAITPVQNGVPFDAFSRIQPSYFSIMGEYASRRDKEKAAADEMELEPSHQQATADETEAGPFHQQATADETEPGPSHQQETPDEMELEPSHQQETPDETEPESSLQKEAPDEMELEPSHQQATPDESEPEPSQQQELSDKTESAPSPQQQTSDEANSTSSPKETPDDAEPIVPTKKIIKLRDLVLQGQQPVHEDVENLRRGIKKAERDIGHIISRPAAVISSSSADALPAAKIRRSVEFKYTSFVTPKATHKSASSVMRHSWKMDDNSGPSGLRFVEVYDGDEESENAEGGEEEYGTHGGGSSKKRKWDEMN
ncbi:hypothetical protein BP5796_04555 [Coleophoma crateriformis]|uniref:Uncharacterized protein n=1 Tax=Coleophoma crateriformis TaxID=565419 RepID=A0A3D8SAC5_9HELO|nr:hypothetical protein BP5796_04555 [Coleophoma crateriformis]